MATEYGRPYFKFVRALNQLNLPFDSILPQEICQYTGNVVFTTTAESPEWCAVRLIREEAFDHHPTVIRGMLVRTLDNRFEEPYLTLGVDPGKRLGLSISYYGREIERSTHSSVGGLVHHMIEVLSGLGAVRKIVKIGNGRMQLAREIGATLHLRCDSDFDVRLVDERRTSLKIKNYNQGGKRDMLSARFISRRDELPGRELPT